ncbi:geraniol 8-hydroxylase-like [Gastrolobium bilobum]|uniref:geraniol 8-hydroxylase-like n=1 Tax=Gastrolobium bilobum TaxID=150636 RepID=UPI002AB20712|nr:geraniol 8-hydroxylase-like [Gastrolobium bilobum]
MEFLSCVLLLVLTFTLAQALRSLLSRGKNNAKYTLPPGPSPLPILGNLLALGKKPHQSLTKLAHIYGPIMSLKLGQVTTIVVSSPEMAKEVLQTHDKFLSNRDVPHAAEVHNHNKHSMAFLPVSPLWRNLRKLSNTQLLSNKSLDESQDLRRNKLQELLHDIQQSSLIGEAVDIGRATCNTAINLLSNTIFSVDLFQSAGSAGDFKELVKHIMQEAGKPNMADIFPALKKLDPQRIYSRNRFYAGKVIDIFRRLVDQRLKQREVQGFDTNNDMLNTLLNIAQENTQEMDTTKIEHLSLSLFIGGTDPVTTTLEWAMAELLQNEKAMEKAKQELEQTIGKGKPVEESDLARLPYVQAVIKETFRLHPPIPFLFPRKADENVEICGYTIPKGARVLVNVWAIGRDSSSWENANVFSPERFLSSEIDVNGRHYELTPFGSGRRICPGLLFAMRILYLMLGSLINCFNWRLEDGMTIEDMNMEDKFGLALAKAEPVRIIPEKISN